jgi:YidC/Oxa1 family membrane protein insertase
MQARQVLTGLLLALAAFVAYQYLISHLFPERPTQVPASAPAPAQMPPTAQATAPSAQASLPATGPGLVFTAGPSTESLTIGQRGVHQLELVLSPRGASVEYIRLIARQKGRYVYRAAINQDDPYELVSPVYSADNVWTSFAAKELQVREFGNYSWALDGLVWTVAESSPEHAVFTATLQSDHHDVLRLTVSYRLAADKPLCYRELGIQNLSEEPLTVLLTQHAATGIRRESPQYDMRRAIVAAVDPKTQTVRVSKAAQRSELRRRHHGELLDLLTPNQGTFAWAALINRFFGVFIRPVTPELEAAGAASLVHFVKGTVALPELDEKLGDLLIRLSSAPVVVPARGQVSQKFEIYAGPTDPAVLKQVSPEFVDRRKVYYSLAHAAGTSCCTFQPLPQLMVGLLHAIHFVVRNYGIAIIVLVLIVRTALHPLSVYQQKQMYRMQESMARLQPKLAALRERYANDKVRLNQEMMQLYAKEGVNPMAGLVGMLPLFIQMPILVALWSGLNSDIFLRHAPFDGWWIKDLAAPDAVISFDPPVSIPILAQLPLVGFVFRDIPSLNLLPILMGLSMWLQQKYMPKPALAAQAQSHTTPRRPGQLSPEDQIRQQRMVGYMMTLMFPFMFYYMPSGLNLYWMATNIFGIGESLLIRRQLEAERKRREAAGPAMVQREGFMVRLLRKMASQAEELQRKADALAERDRVRPRREKD